MLVEPMNPVFAMNSERWVALAQSGKVVILPAREPDAFEVETWAYVPRPFRKSNTVDPLSLDLSLRPSADERTMQALDRMLEKLPW